MYKYLNTAINGDMMEVLSKFPDNSIHTIITDPPYGLKFKNKKWDYQVPSVDQFKELLRIIKPGGMLLCFGGSRTFHRMAINIEDAGWYINDTIMWIHGQGFPKSVDISYMIDKRRKSEGDITAFRTGNKIMGEGQKRQIYITEPNLDEAKKWYGWGTALKPAFEPIIIANKHIEGNYDDNAINQGVAGFHIDGVRIGENESFGIERTSKGRYPSNLIFDEDSSAFLDERFSKKELLSRFYYCAKASNKEKGENNTCPTVKPLSLMDYLVKLTNMPNETITLDPFAGSGSTLIALRNNNRNFIGIEREKEYFDIIQERLKDER